jgi:hypothetical protein
MILRAFTRPVSLCMEQAPLANAGRSGPDVVQIGSALLPVFPHSAGISTDVWAGCRGGPRLESGVAMAEFTHLHLHTEYWLLDGACDVTKLVEWAGGVC